jgi:uncharacterized protein with PIN domain
MRKRCAICGKVITIRSKTINLCHKCDGQLEKESIEELEEKFKERRQINE